jgi:hypothetical protein
MAAVSTLSMVSFGEWMIRVMRGGFSGLKTLGLRRWFRLPRRFRRIDERNGDGGTPARIKPVVAGRVSRADTYWELYHCRRRAAAASGIIWRRPDGTP